MEIKGKAHLLFEQSGTFKREFIKLGIPAFDYDIQNNFGETDYQIDLFAEIENAYGGGQNTIFQRFTNDDLIMAFFPCIYFCAISQMLFSWNDVNYRKLTIKEKTEKILERSANREAFFRLLVKLVSITEQNGLRLIIENPWSEQTFLKANFVMPPTIVEKNRQLRGDYYVKPTAYFFIGCKRTSGQTFCQPKEKKNVMWAKQSKEAGICSEERSMISPDYARNFICDFVLGKVQKNTQLRLFD